MTMIPHSRENIAERLATLRHAMGFKDNASAFCRLLGDSITPQKWNNYEAARNAPGLDVVALIKQKTGASTDWILFGDERYLPAYLFEKIRAAQEERAGEQAPRRAGHPAA